MWLWPVVAGGLVVALLVGVVVVSRGGTSGDTATASGEIFLEPAGSLGDRPFSSTNLAGPVPSTVPPSTTLPPGGGGATTAVRSVAGNAVGLYGGTGNQRTCDRDQMAYFLQSSPSYASAFVVALNADPTLRWSGGSQVTVAQLPQYLHELTPIVLTHDTRVTNHGYQDGRPTPRQAVLQSGTAVLVDAYGVPRARCACGNPLLPPARVTTAPAYQGVPWYGWNPAGVIVVTEVTVKIDTFVLVDVYTGTLVNRPRGTDGRDDTPNNPAGTTTTRPTTTTTTTPAGTPPAGPPSVTLPPTLGTGDVQATLTWTGDIDLDLHVIDPAGSEIYYSAKTSPSGGNLDHDKIPSANENGPHVENVFWATGTAPRGSYDVWVRALSGSASTSSPFTLTVSLNGTPFRAIEGNLSMGNDSQHITFTV